MKNKGEFKAIFLPGFMGEMVENERVGSDPVNRLYPVIRTMIPAMGRLMLCLYKHSRLTIVKPHKP